MELKMKIKEINESFDTQRHSVEAAVFPKNIIAVNSAIKKILYRYKNKEILPEEAIQTLETIDALLEELFYSDYFDHLKNIIPNHYTKLSEDWISLEELLKSYITQIKQKHGIREDAMNFKAKNG